jgi:diacylglycerol O-acyltransferase / wax synthase
MSKIYLNNVDLAWLRMETPVNPMMITVCIRFSGQINLEQLIADLDGIVKRYRRFHQHIVRPTQLFRRAYWEDEPSDRVEDHIEHEDLPSPRDDAAIQELVNKKMNTPLDFAHPLWKITLVDNHPDGNIVIARLHHCIGDGISLMQVLMQMTTTEPPAKLRAAQMPGGDGRHAESVKITTPDGEIEPIVEPTRGAKVVHPSIADMIAAVFRLVFRPADPPSLLKGPLGPIKKAVWTEPYSLPELKQMARSKGATTNDLLMAIMTGAILRYIDLHHDERKNNIRAFTMVNMRGRTIDDDLGNKFGLVFLTMPLELAEPLDRLEGVKQGMDQLKASAEYAASFLILNILGMLPHWVERLAIQILDAKGTVVSTNVPGSRKLLYLADAPIQSMIAWVPQSGRIGVGISFVSYNNQLVVGLNVDVGVIPDPEKFLDLFREEYHAYQAILSSEPLAEVV